jgi:hypothetical protein
VIKGATWLLAAPIFVALFAGQVRIDFMSGPPLPLPGYPGLWRNNNVQGEITVLVKFEKGGKADSVALLSSKLSGRWKESDWGSLEQEIFKGIEKYLLKWESTVRSLPPQEVTVAYRIDPSLPDRQMNYLLSYGKFDLYRRIEIVAAPPSR